MYFKIKIEVLSILLISSFGLFGYGESCTTQEHRPRYHFSPAKNWLNDPNGMIFYDGVFHLYYQYHPGSSEWGPMHWGHAVSRDLVTWEEMDIAIYPDEIGYIYSGSSVLDSGNTTGFKPIDSDHDPIVAIYTSASGENNVIQRQSIAVSLDNGMTFTPYEHNPVLADPNKPDFRDPKVSFIDGQWMMALAVHDRIEFFSSPDLKEWRLESEFGRDPSEGAHGGVWECPDLLSFDVDVGGGQRQKLWVLIVSINPGGPNIGSATHYFIGSFTKNSTNHYEFHTYQWNDAQWLDWGPDNYAGVTFSNMPNDRHVYMGWLNNWIYANQLPTATWRGQMTIPRELSIKILDHGADKYRLVSKPVKELEDLRNPIQHLEVSQEFRVPPQTIVSLTEQATFETPTMELTVTLSITNNPKFSICAHNSENEETCFGHDGNQWYLDREKSGNVNFNDNFGRMLLSHAKREIDEQIVNVKIFLDVSSIEVFVDDGLTTMTALYYPSKPFTKFYINNWSQPSEDSIVSVQKFDIWGLQCWYPE